MKIVLATDIIGPGGGPAGYTYNLLEGFRLRDTSSDEFSVAAGVPVDEVRYRGVGEQKAEGRALAGVRWALARLPHWSLHQVLSTVRWLTSSRDRRHRASFANADVVVFQGYQPSVRGRWAKRRGKTVVYMPHSPNPVADEMRILELATDGFSPQPRFDFLRRDEERFIALADVLAVASPGADEQYRKTFPSTMATADVRIVSSGVGVPQPNRPAPTDGDGIPTVLYAGRYVSHKGYDLFLDAARIASERGVRARFMTLGTGPDRTGSVHVQDLGWSEDPASHLRDASLVVVPNRIAYFDLLPLEAAALGKPLVLTAVGGSVDQLRSLPDTVAAAPESTSVADAIIEALALIEERPDYGRSNAEAYRRTFTPERLADVWATLFTTLCGSRVQARRPRVLSAGGRVHA